LCEKSGSIQTIHGPEAHHLNQVNLKQVNLDRVNPITPFLLRQGSLIVDGGLATELEARGFDLADELWSARLLIDEPQAIKQVHTDYLAAGADCIITASYQGTIEGFMGRGLSEQEAIDLLILSVRLGIEARDEFWSELTNRAGRIRPIVAASVGPYGAALADGSEYRGDYGLDEEGLFNFHCRRWHILANAGADIMACETIPSYIEARALTRLLSETPESYAWFSFSCQNERHISDGTPIADCASYLQGNQQVVAVGINCTAPQFILPLVSEVRRVSDRPIVVYPNSGEEYDALSKRWFGTTNSDDFAQASLSWHDAGASIVGGCCRTSPEHIRSIRREIIAPVNPED
jgi:homocysteine S-methyltransferase